MRRNGKIGMFSLGKMSPLNRILFKQSTIYGQIESESL